MTILIVEGWESETLPTPAVRWDLAWPLYLPACPGDLPEGRSRGTDQLARWFWETMNTLGGFLRQPAPGPVFCLTPPMTVAGRDFVVRLASSWADTVYQLPQDAVREGRTAGEDNLWTAPVANVFSAPPHDSAAARLTARDETAEQRFLMPVLGVGRAFMRVEVIQPGYASARLHSHSAVDEYYLVLEGRATLRMASHQRTVLAGDLIAKPVGPDLTSHLVADLGEPVTILDMEVWPDPGLGVTTKDLVHYPDFGEVLLRGAGWGAIHSDRVFLDPTDFREHYSAGYVRTQDGGWEPAGIPGTEPRRS
jgi:uncharacterized cupin superfamily protein